VIESIFTLLLSAASFFPPSPLFLTAVLHFPTVAVGKTKCTNTCYSMIFGKNVTTNSTDVNKNKCASIFNPEVMCAKSTVVDNGQVFVVLHAK